MKKSLILLAAAALTLVACNKTVVVEENQGDAISFRPLMENMTKASATDSQVITSFSNNNEIKVWADYKSDGSSESKYFYDTYTFSDSPSNHFTPSTGVHYWPGTVDATHTVTYYATYGGVTQTAGGVFAGFTPQEAASSQIDLLVAKHISTAVETPVVLNFRHALSQIAVKVQNTNAALKFTVKGVRIGYINTTATAFSLSFDSSATNSDTQQESTSGALTSGANMIAAASWTLADPTSADANKYEQVFASDKYTVFEGTGASTELTIAANGFYPWILLPQTMHALTTSTFTGTGKEYVHKTSNKEAAGITGDTPDLSGSYIALKLTIDNWNGTSATGNIVTDTWCYWPIDEAGAWTPGLKYTYTVDLAGGGYKPNDIGDDGKLDPIMTPIVISPSCTIDVWNAQAEDAIGN